LDTVKEKIAYLRGMLDSSKEIAGTEQLKTVLLQMVDILNDLADDVDDLYYGQEELEEYLEAIDADLADLEEAAEDYDDEECDCHDHDLEMVEMECPRCHNTVAFEEDFLYDDDVTITCPDCGEIVYDSQDLEDDEESIESE